MKWCCEPAQKSAIVDYEYDTKVFVLVNVSEQTSETIKYCPFCGKRLELVL